LTIFQNMMTFFYVHCAITDMGSKLVVDECH